VETLLARRRGSAPWKAFQKASYDAKLYELDRQLGRLIEGLQAHRDPEALHLVIVGTRGCYLVEARPDAQLEGLSEGLLRTALVVRLPGLAVGRRQGIVSAQRIAPTLLALAFADPATDLGQGLDAAPFEGELRVLSPRVRAFAEVSRSWKWIVKDGWDCEPRLVLRDGDRIVEGASMWEVLEEELGEGLAEELRERAQTVGTEIPHGGRLRLLGSAARVLVRDPSGSIRGRRSDGDGLRIRTDRRAALPSPSNSRAPALRSGWIGSGFSGANDSQTWRFPGSPTRVRNPGSRARDHPRGASKSSRPAAAGFVSSFRKHHRLGATSVSSRPSIRPGGTRASPWRYVGSRGASA
jgi:hypothetical protein